MAEVYKSKAAKSAKGVWFAPGKNDHGYIVFKLCENYAGHVRGGIVRSWRAVNQELSLTEAMNVMEKRVGRKLYE
jgi:hypothetical protein